MKVYLIRRKRDGLYYEGHWWRWGDSTKRVKLYRTLKDVKLALHNLGKQKWDESSDEFYARMNEHYDAVVWTLDNANLVPIPLEDLWEIK